MRVTLTVALSGLLATSPAYATTLDINVEVPKLNVAEYHRPYVAVWLEGADQKVAANLSVWYQQTGNSEGHGTKWLPGPAPVVAQERPHPDRASRWRHRADTSGG